MDENLLAMIAQMTNQQECKVRDNPRKKNNT
jgi:hypothetical protein